MSRIHPIGRSAHGATPADDRGRRARSRRVRCRPIVLGLENRVLPSLAATSLFTNSSPVSITTGTPTTTLTDRATLSGGHYPSGIITFTLYDPSSIAVHTETLAAQDDGT